ncbi:MAG: hypothetical protein A2W91_03005 [Bacteroidetes bacterium GWF2_38_335]|nr:MAG: hypothetical protein A2W91_03005 [Bacteroidetes bacterium GWF2_38_335]OFY77541.1 MAG: hypothetical protein A2281_01755 [Bacteroidetes bacterium RIFOXYA12_FULL_38_20]HBS87162.1 hypothetical protein [Bacteroidales bacterium]
MSFRIIPLFTFIVLFFFSSNTFSQEATDTVKKVKISMKNGEDFSGVLISQDKGTIRIRNENGEMNLIIENVKSIEYESATVNYSVSNPNSSRYFFSHTAIPYEKNKFYYQNTFVFLNTLDYGLTKNLSIGGGFEFISTVVGYPIFLISPKAGFKIKNKFHLGTGAFFVGIPGEFFSSFIYGTATYGTRESNVSLGATGCIINNELYDYGFIMFGGMHRISNGVSLLSENYYTPYIDNKTGYFGIHGIRLLSSTSHFDFGVLIIPVIVDFIPALPYISFVRVF